MTEEEFKKFMYCCKSYAGQFHFVENHIILNIASKYNTNESAFNEVMLRNYRIVKDMHIGVCFTFACFIKVMLETMGITDDIYFMDSYDPKNSEPNKVILYKYNNQWLVCDFGEYIKGYEEINGSIISASALLTENREWATQVILENAEKINSIEKLEMSVMDYCEQYPMRFCQVYLSKGNEETPFGNVPIIGLKDFLQSQKEPSTHVL